jgi:hypothetical protein
MERQPNTQDEARAARLQETLKNLDHLVARFKDLERL